MARPHPGGGPCRRNRPPAGDPQRGQPDLLRYSAALRGDQRASLRDQHLVQRPEEPIINRPEEALRALEQGRVDMLVTETGIFANGPGARAPTGHRIDASSTREDEPACLMGLAADPAS